MAWAGSGAGGSHGPNLLQSADDASPMPESPKPYCDAPWDTPSGSRSTTWNTIGCPGAGDGGSAPTSTVIGLSGPGCGSNRKGPQAGSVLLRQGDAVVTVVAAGVPPGWMTGAAVTVV